MLNFFNIRHPFEMMADNLKFEREICFRQFTLWGSEMTRLGGVLRRCKTDGSIKKYYNLLRYAEKQQNQYFECFYGKV